MGDIISGLRTALQANSAYIYGDKETFKSGGTNVKTSNAKVAMDLSDFAKISGDQLNRAMGNVYLRQQFLADIRGSLKGRGGEESVQRFLKSAEVALLGKNVSQKGDGYDLQVAGQDLSSVTVGGLLKALDKLTKDPDVASSMNDKQCAALGGLDSATLAKALDMPKEALSRFSLAEIKMSQDGMFVECKVKVPKPNGGQDEKGILIGRDGGVVSKSVHAQLLTLVGNICSGTEANVIANSFRTEDMADAVRFCKLIDEGGQSFQTEIVEGGECDNVPSEGGCSIQTMQAGMLNELVTALPAARQKLNSGTTDKPLSEVLWKELHLEGNPPADKAQLGRKFFDSLRERIFKDVLGHLGLANDETAKTILMPKSEIEFIDIGETTCGRKFTTAIVQTVNYLIQPGYSVRDKINFLSGKKSFDYNTLPVKSIAPVSVEKAENNNGTQEVRPKNSRELLSDAELSFAGTDREKGTRYRLNGTLVHTVRQSQNGSADLVKKLNQDYTPKQIYQCAHYLNNGGAYTLMSLGLVPDMENSEIDITPDNSGGMHVCARLHKKRVMGVAANNNEDDRTNVKVEQTNESIVHDFVIKRNGSIEVKGLRIETPSVVKKTRTKQKIGGM